MLIVGRRTSESLLAWDAEVFRDDETASTGLGNDCAHMSCEGFEGVEFSSAGRASELVEMKRGHVDMLLESSVVDKVPPASDAVYVGDAEVCSVLD